MKWQDASEIIAGFVYKGKLDPNAVNLADMHPATAHIVQMRRDGKEDHEIVSKDFSAVDASVHAVERVNGSLKGPLEYVKILEESAKSARCEADLNKIQNKIKSGESISAVDILAIADKMETGYQKFIPMSQVEPQKIKFVKTGYAPIDFHTGGIPYACLTIIAANPGVGKTTLGLRIILNMLRLKENKKKKVAILSLEMTMGQIHQRYIEISDLTKEEKDRVLLNRIFNIHEITAAITQLVHTEQIAAVLIDFADLIVEGEQTESAMGVIYRNLELLATKTEVPIILICQLNREMYKGGLPRIHHIRYSGLAEATARMILLVYNPTQIVADFQKSEDSPLPAQDGIGYIIVGKSNFGYKEGKPGAIRVEWDGEGGWGEKSLGYIKLAI